MNCQFCGQTAACRIQFHAVSPRGEYDPSCMDPYFSHGSWSVETCGSPGCEAEAFADMVHHFPDADIEVNAEPVEDESLIGDDA